MKTRILSLILFSTFILITGSATFFLKRNMVTKVEAIPDIAQKNVVSSVPSPEFTPETASVFFPQGEICKGQSKEIKDCDKNNGQWSCSSHHCVLLEEKQLLMKYQADCLQQKNSSTECLQSALSDYKNILDFQKPDDQKCIGSVENIKLCNERGLQWNCKIGACIQTAYKPVIFNVFYRHCNNERYCISAMNRIMKNICINQFKNEYCLPDDNFVEMNHSCLEQKTSDMHLAAWSPRHHTCFKDSEYSPYFENLRLCLETKSHSLVAKPSQKSKIFNTVEECITHLDLDVDNWMKHTQRRTML